jgi:hypothetical protein
MTYTAEYTFYFGYEEAIKTPASHFDRNKRPLLTRIVAKPSWGRIRTEYCCGLSSLLMPKVSAEPVRCLISYG